MKILSLFLFCCALSSNAAYAQRRQFMEERRAELEAEKRVFVDAEAGFSSTESATYWILKEEYEQAKVAFNQSQREKSGKGKKPAEFTEAEAEAYLMERLNKQRSLLDLNETYLRKGIQTLGAKTLLRGLIAEKAWKRELLRRLSEFKQEKGEDSDPIDF